MGDGPVVLSRVRQPFGLVKVLRPLRGGSFAVVIFYPPTLTNPSARRVWLTTGQRAILPFGLLVMFLYNIVISAQILFLYKSADFFALV